jgi:RimJ/RimL family protein N-acetyltransferase
MTELRGSSFLLRRYRKGDERDLVEWLNNPKIGRYTLGIPYPYTQQDAEFWISKATSAKSEGSHFAIARQNRVIGGIGLYPIEGHKAHLGYWLAEPFWGQGITAEAAGLISRYAFDTLGLARLYAPVFLPNKQSARVLEKAGFTLEGIHRKYFFKNGEAIDGLIYAKVKT